MFFLTFILGLVALIADEQFGGQHAVGWTLLGVTVFLFIVQLVLAGAIVASGAKVTKTSRGRRGF